MLRRSHGPCTGPRVFRDRRSGAILSGPLEMASALSRVISEGSTLARDGVTVFENSTACATWIDVRSKLRPDTSAGRPSGWLVEPRSRSNPVMTGAPNVYVAPHEVKTTLM